jgi:hypothetical protein
MTVNPAKFAAFSLDADLTAPHYIFNTNDETIHKFVDFLLKQDTHYIKSATLEHIDVYWKDDHICRLVAKPTGTSKNKVYLGDVVAKKAMQKLIEEFKKKNNL